MTYPPSAVDLSSSSDIEFTGTYESIFNVFMKIKFKTVRVILYSKKDHVMNTPPPYGFTPFEKVSGCGTFQKILDFPCGCVGSLQHRRGKP